MMNYKTPIPKGVQEYIDIIENGECRSNVERRLLIEHVKEVFRTEELRVDEVQIEKYLSYQKYFPFDLFPWEKFCFILFTCVFRKDGTPRWSDLFALMGRGAGKNGFLSFICFCLITETNGVAYYENEKRSAWGRPTNRRNARKRRAGFNYLLARPFDRATPRTRRVRIVTALRRPKNSPCYQRK